MKKRRPLAFEFNFELLTTPLTLLIATFIEENDLQNFIKTCRFTFSLFKNEESNDFWRERLLLSNGLEEQQLVLKAEFTVNFGSPALGIILNARVLPTTIFSSFCHRMAHRESLSFRDMKLRHDGRTLDRNCNLTFRDLGIKENDNILCNALCWGECFID